MNTWQESEHPRDDEGKFTFKNGGASSGGSKDLAKVLVKESGFKKIYEQSKTKMKNNLEVESSLDFEDTNFYNALGSVDIKQMKFRKNGDLELLVTDVYDFNKNSKSK